MNDPGAVPDVYKRQARTGSERSRRVYLPALGIVAAAVVLIGIGWVDGWGGAGFADTMSGLRVVLIGPLTLGILAVLLVAERVRPAQRRPLIALSLIHISSSW